MSRRNAKQTGHKSLKRKRAEQTEEIKFDFEARREYLTGFHKRKLQRAQHAREQAAKKDREDRIHARKLVGEQTFNDLDWTHLLISYVNGGKRSIRSTCKQ